EVVLVIQGDAQAAVRHGVLGFKRNGLVEAGNGAIIIVFRVTKNRANGLVGIIVFGVKLNSRAEGADGLLQVPLVLLGVAQVVVGLSVVGVEFDRGVEAADGRLQVFLGMQSDAQA